MEVHDEPIARCRGSEPGNGVHEGVTVKCGWAECPDEMPGFGEVCCSSLPRKLNLLKRFAGDAAALRRMQKKLNTGEPLCDGVMNFPRKP